MARRDSQTSFEKIREYAFGDWTKHAVDNPPGIHRSRSEHEGDVLMDYSGVGETVGAYVGLCLGERPRGLARLWTGRSALLHVVTPSNRWLPACTPHTKQIQTLAINSRRPGGLIAEHADADAPFVGVNATGAVRQYLSSISGDRNMPEYARAEYELPDLDWREAAARDFDFFAGAIEELERIEAAQARLAAT